MQPENTNAPNEPQIVVPGNTPPSNSPSNQSSNYDFILNPKKKKASINPLAGRPIKQQVIMIGIVLIALLIMINIARGLLAGKSDKDYYINIVQNQQQLIVLSENALDVNSLSTENRNYAITTLVSVRSDQVRTLRYLSKQKVKIKPAVLNSKVDLQANKNLAAAIPNDRYNKLFYEVSKEKMKNYQNSLVQTYKITENKGTKKVLSQYYDSSELLKKMLKEPSI